MPSTGCQLDWSQITGCAKKSKHQVARTLKYFNKVTGWTFLGLCSKLTRKTEKLWIEYKLKKKKNVAICCRSKIVIFSAFKTTQLSCLSTEEAHSVDHWVTYGLWLLGSLFTHQVWSRFILLCWLEFESFGIQFSNLFSVKWFIRKWLA